MEIFRTGETVVIKSEHKVDGEFIDPDTSITVNIYCPQNSAKVEDGTMVSSGSAGKHYYNYTVAADATFGVWRAIVKTVHIERTTKEEVEFEVSN